MKIQLILLVAFLAATQAQKYLALQNSQFNLTKESIILTESQNTFKFNELQRISQFVFQNGQSEDIVKNAVFISNTPYERLSVVRCGKLNKAQERPDLSFGSKFEEFFKKRNFTLIINEQGDECFGFNILYQKNWTDIINPDQIQLKLNQFLNSSFPEVQQNELQLSLKLKFEIEVNYNNKNQTRYIRIASNYNKFILDVHSSIPVILNDKFEIFKGQVRETTEYLNARSFYTSIFTRQALGTGLHQKSQIEFRVGMGRNDLINEGKGCELVIVDYLDNTQYVDIDELYLHENLNMTNYRVHDIERPSSLSPQHIYLLKYRFKDSDISLDQKQIYITLSMNETYLFHYRYRTPFEGEYKQSFMNHQPYFLINCIKHQKKSTIDIQTSMIERMVNVAYNSTQFRQLKVFQNTRNNTGILERQIPVGNIADKDITLYITIFLTVTVCIFFSFKVLRVSKKYKL